jgi:hypothetical protein
MPLTNGLVVMTPTSVAKTGTGSTATINSDGSVTFAACETLSLNGVFTSSYDNYMITIRISSSADQTGLGRLRSAGTDASGSNYTRQYLLGNSTTISADRETSQTTFRAGSTSSNLRGGDTLFMFGPYLSQPTAMRQVTIYSSSGGMTIDAASTHSLSSSYDGLTLLYSPNNATGLITVFGFNQ